VASNVSEAGNESTGGVVSWTLIVKIADAELPCPSVAVQVTVVVPRANTPPDVASQVTTSEPSTMSVAVAAPNVTVAPAALVASTIRLGGTTMVGGVVSFTVTLKFPGVLLPAASVAEQLTVVAVIPNVEPDSGAHVGETDVSTLSVALAVYDTAAPAGPVASAVMSAGSRSAGPSRSATVTTNWAELACPPTSDEVQVTVVLSSGNRWPETGSHETGRDPSTRSSAVGSVKVNGAPDALTAAIVVLAGTSVRTGPAVSWTVIVNVADPVLPFASVAEHVTVVMPSTNIEPEAGIHGAARDPLTASDAVPAANVATAPPEPVASIT